ncbi:TetR/AcrR family transcriptional regulator [Propionicicella superfundia]|uniref:TetR/AcrR family transcriptional regulator n=1 Tax=Propionicicella superfundia TaxID=348582 RepID=UPI0004207DB6|nr:TetR/AcrR family transcriptional regulator [Propionicicella superfundia]
MTDSTLTARRAHTRDRLLDAALEIFAAKGVQAATVEEICERAGFTRGAFYSNFESKDDLCVAAFRRFVADAEQTVRAAVDVVPQTLGDEAQLPDVLDAALGVALDKGIAAPTRVLAQLEIRLHFLRNPHLADKAPKLGGTNAIFVELLDNELQRIRFGLRLPTAQAIDLLGCVLESHTMRGSDPAMIHALMRDTLKAMIVRLDGACQA